MRVARAYFVSILMFAASASAEYTVLFNSVGYPATSLNGHTATLLSNGKVLIAGGTAGNNPTNGASLFDPRTGVATRIANMTVARVSHTATLLPNGKVLIAGGFNYAGTISSAEIYDPAAGTFIATGSMVLGRSGQTATLLRDGTVLIAGGLYSGGQQVSETYDPAAGTFTAAGAMATDRVHHTATLLPDGNVLVAGGETTEPLSSAELYEPSKRTFRSAGTMTVARSWHTATLLPNGLVLIVCGLKTSQTMSNTAELYDASKGTFTQAPFTLTARAGHTATLLRDGTVLLTGGDNQPQRWDPAQGSAYKLTTYFNPTNVTATLLPGGQVLFVGGGQNEPLIRIFDCTFALALPTAGNLPTAADAHAATLLPNGKVLIAGGETDYVPTAATSVYDPSTKTFAAGPSLANPRLRPTATLLGTGRVLIAGGSQQFGGSPSGTAELFDSSNNSLTATGSLQTARSGHTATLLGNGKVLVAGGWSTQALASAEIYDAAAGTFTATGSLAKARNGHSATLLPSGKVLVAGGFDGSTYTATAELFDPAAGTFSSTGSMTTARSFHTATLLPSGLVLMLGGYNGGVLATGEIYDPSTGTFTATTSMLRSRTQHTATVLASGAVLIVGGNNGNAPLELVELYEPAGAVIDWATAIGTARYGHSVTVLPDHTLLIAGGLGNTGTLTSAEVYELGFAASRQPVVTAPSSISNGATLTLSGTGFSGDSPGGNGGSNASVSNVPIVTLDRIDSGQRVVVVGTSPLDAATSWSGTVSGLAVGPHRLTLAVGAVPSVQKIIYVGSANPSLSGASPNRGPVDGSQTVTLSGTNLSGVTVTIGGTAANVTGTTSTTATIVTPAHAAGAVDVVVRSADGGSATLAGGYTYVNYPTITAITPDRGPVEGGQTVTITGTELSGVTVTFDGVAATITNTTPTSATVMTPAHFYGAVDVIATTPGGESVTRTKGYTYGMDDPTNLIATAISPTSVALTWKAPEGATGYSIQRRDAVNQIFNPIGSSPTPSFTDNSVVPGKTYQYLVVVTAPFSSRDSNRDVATTVIFTDPGLGTGTVMKAAHLNELRTAATALRRFSLLDDPTFTDAIQARVTPIRAVHVTELRNAIAPARAIAGLAAIQWTNATLTAGSTPVRAIDIRELRDAVK